MLNALSGFTLCIFVATAAAQQKPNFSGAWAAQAAALNPDGVFGGSVIQIEQDASEIRIARSYGREGIKNPPVVLKISLDGKDGPLPYPMEHRAGITGALSGRARWDGNRLVIVTTRTTTDATKKTSKKTETTETLSFDSSRLVVDRVVSPGKPSPQKEIWLKR